MTRLDYSHAKQFKHLRKTVKRQRTILGIMLREVQRKIDQQVGLDGTALTQTAPGGRAGHQSLEAR